MLEAVLRCEQPHSWLKLAANKYSAAVKILDSKILPANVVQHLFDIDVDPKTVDELLKEIHRDEDVLDMEAMKSKGGRVYGSISALRCTVCRLVAVSKCFLASVAVTSKEGAEWTILGNNDSFRELLKSLEREKIKFEVRLRRNLENSYLLTERQEQILSIAFERGYFDFPKKIGLEELGTEIGIKTSTLAEILRRGQRKILGEYLTRRPVSYRGNKST